MVVDARMAIRSIATRSLTISITWKKKTVIDHDSVPYIVHGNTAILQSLIDSCFLTNATWSSLLEATWLLRWNALGCERMPIARLGSRASTRVRLCAFAVGYRFVGSSNTLFDSLTNATVDCYLLRYYVNEFFHRSFELLFSRSIHWFI